MDDVRAVAAMLTRRQVPDLADEDGRPVGEVAATWYRDVVTDTVRCPYRDARHGGVMNRSALRQMGGVWPALLATFRALGGPEPRVIDAFRAALVGISAPAAAHVAHPERPIPNGLAALYKTSLGLSQVTAALLLADDGVADAPLSELGDGVAFFRFLDDGRWLLGEEQVCAGSEAMIVEAWEGLLGRRGALPPSPPPALGAPSASRDTSGGASATRPTTSGSSGLSQTSGSPGGGGALPPSPPPAFQATLGTPSPSDAGIVLPELAELRHERWLPVAHTLVGAVAVAGLAVGGAAAGLEGWIGPRGPAWTRALFSAPGRGPEHARRLFARGAIPPSVEAMITMPPASGVVWAARIEEAVNASY
ncbi:MAG: hypothetical protein H6735_01415 [Alphaproteobacteria bacterium]|nr:hypothetical protein [Alphaproteobacteria bacterium]